MKGPLYNFGMSQEDERTEAAALGLSSDEEARVLSVCSAGEMPLCLLAMGAAAVDAVDVDEGQLHLARLKRAAVLTLEREQAIRLLGYMPAPLARRRDWLGRALSELPPSSREFWGNQPRALEAGPIWSGRYERYVSRLVRLLRLPLGRRIDGLFACTSLDQQETHFRRAFDRSWLRAVFGVAFHPRIYARRGMDPRSLQHRIADRTRPSLGLQFFERFRALCTHTLAQENHMLQLHLLGRVLSSDTVPYYLTSDGYDAFRRRVDRLTLRRCDLHDALRSAPPGAYNRFHLSNLPDWMSAEGFETTMRLLGERSDRSGRAVWRYLHVDRSVPEYLRAAILIDLEYGRRLERSDRFPLYTVVPARLNPEEAGQ